MKNKKSFFIGVGVGIVLIVSVFAIPALSPVDDNLPKGRTATTIVDGEYPASYFPNTVTSYYWSSTTSAYVTFYAWTVYGGSVDDYGKSNYGYVRAVRGGRLVDDYDCDAILDDLDNCFYIYNPDQEDTYPPGGNGIGDACDCEGNFDCDEDVDGTNAATFKADFGRSLMNNPCESGEPCNGDFDCDNDCDGTDAALFKSDFGRSSFNNPCPACVVGDWCGY